jgi:hypothetical protein
MTGGTMTILDQKRAFCNRTLDSSLRAAFDSLSCQFDSWFDNSSRSLIFEILWERDRERGFFKFEILEEFLIMESDLSLIRELEDKVKLLDRKSVV